MKIGIFTGGTSVRLKNIFSAISRYPTGKHEINSIIQKIYYFDLLQNFKILVYILIKKYTLIFKFFCEHKSMLC